MKPAALVALVWVPAVLAASSTDPRSAIEDLRSAPFDQLHSSRGTPGGGALIFGALKPVHPASRARSGLLGRWEGYDLALPVPRDWKIVLFVEAIQGDRGRIVFWMGTNLQRPKYVKRFPVKVHGNGAPVLTWRANLEGAERTFSFRYDPASDRLLGTMGFAFEGVPPAQESVVLTRDRSFLVYRDYPAYLASKRISARAYQNPALARFGRGYLVYLPPGYESSSELRWPLVLFFCGSGDRGVPVEDLAKASPFMFIRERGDLSAIIVAPALNEASGYRSFPSKYMQGVLDEMLSRYRVDPERVAVTGLSMGGEAAFRFALTNPARIAAAAVLSMADPRFDRGLQLAGFEVTEIPYQRAVSVWFYFVNGGRDPWIQPEAVKRTVDDLRTAGVKTEWKLLLENGHDTWTDTYSDPAFYEWLLSKRR